MNESDRLALLAQLRDVQTPPVSAWPAPGWWLILLLMLLLSIVSRWRLRRWRERLWQRQALAELARIRAQSTQQAHNRTLTDCSTLCRRVLLLARGRDRSAGLQGQAWLKALDAVTGRELFTGGGGRLLEAKPYQRDPSVSQHDLERLFDAIDELIHSVSQRPIRRSGS